MTPGTMGVTCAEGLAVMEFIHRTILLALAIPQGPRQSGILGWIVTRTMVGMTTSGDRPFLWHLRVLSQGKDLRRVIAAANRTDPSKSRGLASAPSNFDSRLAVHISRYGVAYMESAARCSQPFGTRARGNSSSSRAGQQGVAHGRLPNSCKSRLVGHTHRP